MNAKTTTAALDHRGEGADHYHNVMDDETASGLWKAMAVLSMGIEATIDGNVERVAAQWPTVAEAVWDILDRIMVRAGVSEGNKRPWISAKEDAA